MNDNNNKKNVNILDFNTFILPIILGFMVIGLAVFYWQSIAPKPVMIAYLYPASDAVPNIWLAPVDNPDEARQATFSTIGIYDFAVDTQGKSIAFSMRNETNLARDIYLLDIASGNTERLTFCGDESAECFTPVFHPTNAVIAYTQLQVSTPNDNTIPESDDPHAGHNHGSISDTHIWVMDLDTGTKQPLGDDAQLVGHSPVWSDNGDTIAYYSANLDSQGVMVYNFNPEIDNSQTLNFIPSQNGSVGTLSPDGSQIIIPDIVNRNEQFFTYLRLIDFTETPVTFENFSDPDSPVDDISAKWHPNGERVTISRRYTDSRWTRGYQLFDVDVASGEVTTLLYDENYGHYFFEWDRLGDNLLLQRLPIQNADGTLNNLARPEIWVLNYESGDLFKIAESAYLPRWVIPE